MPSQVIEYSSPDSANQQLEGSLAGSSETHADTESSSETRRFDIAKSLASVFEDICEGQESKLHTAARCGMHDKVVEAKPYRYIFVSIFIKYNFHLIILFQKKLSIWYMGTYIKMLLL